MLDKNGFEISFIYTILHIRHVGNFTSYVGAGHVIVLPCFAG